MALAVFVMPPDMETLKQRLIKRGTENETSLVKRLEKAEWELTFADRFDRVVINDDLDTAIAEVKSIVKSFISDE
jgi:guanylate kinase